MYTSHIHTMALNEWCALTLTMFSGQVHFSSLEKKPLPLILSCSYLPVIVLAGRSYAVTLNYYFGQWFKKCHTYNLQIICCTIIWPFLAQT